MTEEKLIDEDGHDRDSKIAILELRMKIVMRIIWGTGAFIVAMIGTVFTAFIQYLVGKLP